MKHRVPIPIYHEPPRLHAERQAGLRDLLSIYKRRYQKLSHKSQSRKSQNTIKVVNHFRATTDPAAYPHARIEMQIP